MYHPLRASLDPGDHFVDGTQWHQWCHLFPVQLLTIDQVCPEPKHTFSHHITLHTRTFHTPAPATPAPMHIHASRDGHSQVPPISFLEDGTYSKEHWNESQDSWPAVWPGASPSAVQLSQLQSPHLKNEALETRKCQRSGIPGERKQQVYTAGIKFTCALPTHP